MIRTGQCCNRGQHLEKCVVPTYIKLWNFTCKTQSVLWDVKVHTFSNFIKIVLENRYKTSQPHNSLFNFVL